MLTRKELTEWTTFLRNNSHLQRKDRLIDESGNMCCLGALCKIQNLSTYVTSDLSEKLLSSDINGHSIGFMFPTDTGLKHSDIHLTGDLADKLGSRTGAFKSLDMPKLRDKYQDYDTLVDANDASVNWSVIADHLDKYYPCEDENASK